LVREIAAGSTVTLHFKKAGQRVVPQVPAGWSSRPEAMRLEPVTTQGALALAAAASASTPATIGPAPTHVRFVYEPALVPQTLTQGVALVNPKTLPRAYRADETALT
jgi:hypothetical protein